MIQSIYEKAIEDFQNRKWIKSWRGFQEVENNDANYKETFTYKQKIKERSNTISIILSGRNRFKEVEYFKNNIITEVSKLENPLIQIIDRENLDQIIEEQKLGLSGLIDEGSVADLGKILGVKAMMLIKILNYNEIAGTLNVIKKTAYTPSSNFVSQNKFDPVPYREYSNTNKLQVSLQYQLISTETAEVLAADIIKKEYRDDLLYAKSTIDHNKLYPAIDGYIYKSGSEREEFLKLFRNVREPLAIQELEFEMQELLAKQVAESLNYYYSK